MVSSSGLLPLFRAVLKGGFVFWKGRGGVDSFVLFCFKDQSKLSVSRQGPL